MSRYTSATDADRAAMLERIGVQSIDELFETIPEGVRLGRALDLPPGRPEQEVFAHLRELASRNVSTDDELSFLGFDDELERAEIVRAGRPGHLAAADRKPVGIGGPRKVEAQPVDLKAIQRKCARFAFEAMFTRSSALPMSELGGVPRRHHTRRHSKSDPPD